MINTVIIDDERLAIKELQHYLKAYEDIRITDTFIDPKAAIDHIAGHRPDLVFLDINMPGIMGIQVAEQLLEIDSSIQVVFVTAYDEYALEAFKVYAFDYIVKPIDAGRLDKTLQRLIGKKPAGPQAQRATLHIRCLGGFEIGWAGEDSLKWRTSKTRELMAFLIHNRGNKLKKDMILDRLWPEQPPAKAIRQLYNGIYYIRKALVDYGISKDMIHIGSDYSVQLSNVVFDVEVLQGLYESGNSDPNDLKAAYPGDYMANCDWDWALPVQQTLRDHFIQQMLTASRGLQKNMQYAEAEDCLKYLYELNPFEEQISFLLVQTYIMKGEKNKAFNHYETYADLVDRELGILPEERFQNVLKFL